MSVFFNGFINYMDTGVKYTLRKIVNDTKMGGTLDFEGTEALQRDLGRLGGCAVLDCMHFNRCRILYLEWGNPSYTCRLGNNRLEHSPTERFWVNRKLNMSHQCPGHQEDQPCPWVHQAQHCWIVERGDCPPLSYAGSPLL